LDTSVCAFVDDVGWHRRLHQRLTLIAHPFAADVTLHGERARRVVQLLADVFANALERTPTGAGLCVRLVVDVGARQLRRQCLALGLALGFRFGRRQERFQFGLNRLEVCVNGFVQQTRLFRCQLLAALAELPALVDGQLVCELVDLGLPVPQLPVLLADLGHQLRSQCAQFVRAQGIEVGG